MKKMNRFGLYLVLACASFFPGTASGDIVGAWSGVLDVTGQELTVIFNIQKEESGYTATMDVPAQGAEGLPATIEVGDGEVKLAVAAAGLSYSGQVGKDEKTIEGTFSQAGLEIPLKLELDAEPGAAAEQAELKRPQLPKPPFPYKSEEVKYDNPDADDVTLAGTLLIPEGEGPFPAVVFISGSGPQDRDETLAGHKPFLVIGDYLSRHGIATLRYDDRGTAESTGDHGAATSYDFADDALAGVAYLKTRSEIDPEKIGLIGHSEGGLIAPVAAKKSDDVAFVVMLAGPSIPGEELILNQLADILRQQGVSEDIVARNMEIDKKLYAIMKSEPDEEKAAELMREVLENRPEEDKEVQLLHTESTIRSRNNVWWRTFIQHDPKPVLASLDIPILALFAEHDINVLPETNVPAIEEAFEESGNPDAKVVVLPGHNHLFQRTDAESTLNYGEIEETINPEVLELLEEWIAKTVASNS